MTETPLSDAAAIKGSCHLVEPNSWDYKVLGHDCREIERKLKKSNVALKRAIEIAEEMETALWRERVNLRAELDQLKATLNQDNK